MFVIYLRGSNERDVRERKEKKGRIFSIYFFILQFISYFCGVKINRHIFYIIVLHQNDKQKINQN